MAAFPGPDGTTRLVRNHEDRNTALMSTHSGSAAKRYDQRGGGGTSTLQVRTLPDGSRVLEKDFMSLSGTIVNCAGGPTSWGSWLTCEETTEGRVVGARRENHGYVFEGAVDARRRNRPCTAEGNGSHGARSRRGRSSDGDGVFNRGPQQRRAVPVCPEPARQARTRWAARDARGEPSATV